MNNVSIKIMLNICLKNGEVIDNVEFLERFVKALNLCENDICIMDRAGYLDYIQPLFEIKANQS